MVLLAEAGGNLHSFEAITPCAVLDVLLPPYSDRQGRPCTYYSESRFFSAGESLLFDDDNLSAKPSGGGSAGPIGQTSAAEAPWAMGDGAWLQAIPQPADFSVGTYVSSDR